MRKNVLSKLLIGACVSMALIFVSCQSESGQESVELIPDEMEQLNKENFISNDEVLENAATIFDRVMNNGGIGTRSNSLNGDYSTRTIKNVQTFNDNRKLAAFYAVNFKEGGFLILSADKRAPNVLAFSEDESFMNPDEMPDEVPYGLTLWMEDFQNAMSAIRYNCFKDLDINKNESDEDKAVTYVLPPTSTFTIINPLLTTTWGKASGFNDSLPNCTPHPQLKLGAGCATVAMSQILKYYEYPLVYNWSAMPDNYATSETAKLYKDVFIECNETERDGCSTATTVLNLRFALLYFGYPTFLSAYSRFMIVNNLFDGIPVLIYSISSNPHVWICDGYCFFPAGTPHFFLDEDDSNYLTSPRHFLHMNWGYYGMSDGYYLDGTSWNVGVSTYPVNDRYLIVINRN